METKFYDWSMLSTFAYCPERFNLSHNLYWGPTREATSLGFGGALHKGLVPIVTSGNLGEGIHKFFEEYARFDGLDEVRTMEKGEELLKAYVEQDRENGWKEVQTEISFAVDLSDSMVVVGRIDKYGTKDGVKAIQDWKTSTQPWQFMANPNHQATMYLLGAQTVLGPEVQDFYFELIGVFKNSENGFRTIRGKGGEPSRMESVFQLVYVQRSPRQIEQFVDQLFVWSRLIEECEVSKTWPWNTENCNGKYGLCPFQPACMAGDGKESVLETMYRKVRWDPIKGESIIL